jgi:hypothetical protein
MRNIIKQIIKESLNEINNEELNFIKQNHNNDRIHMSMNDVPKIYNTTSELTIRAKPTGFWYGFGSSWIDWVNSEMPEWNYEHIFKIDINTNRVLQIKTLDELIEFDKEYSTNNNYGNKNIDWIKVNKRYDGIEINPYQYKARYDISWYYGWDVASGCIWNPKAISNIEKLF